MKEKYPAGGFFVITRTESEQQMRRGWLKGIDNV